MDCLVMGNYVLDKEAKSAVNLGNSENLRRPWETTHGSEARSSYRLID